VGFNRLGPLRKNAGNQEVASSRNEVLTEMTNVVGSSLLGVTLGCARCHDHMFDPIKQSDYYRLEAFFAPAVFKETSLASSEAQKAWDAKGSESRDGQGQDGVRHGEGLEETSLEAKRSQLSEEERQALPFRPTSVTRSKSSGCTGRLHARQQS
jgi:hypothetical protein